MTEAAAMQSPDMGSSETTSENGAAQQERSRLSTVNDVADPQASSNESNTQTKPKAVAKETAPEAPSDYRKIKHRVKDNGKDVEVSYDDLLNGYQAQAVSTRRFQEAARIQKENEQLRQMIQSGNADAVNQMFGSPEAARDYAINLLNKEIELQEMNPDQRRAYDLEQENAKLKQDKEAEFKATQERQQQEIRQKAYQEIDLEVREVIDTYKEAGGKPTPRFAARLVEHMIAQHQNGGQRLSATDAHRRVQTDFKADIEEYAGMVEPAEFVQLLPKSVIKAVQNMLLDKATVANPAGKPPAKQGEGHIRRSKKVKSSTDDYFKELEKKFS